MTGAENDLTTELAKELAKNIPVKEIYTDAVSPAARQVGQIGLDIVKTIQLALAPFQIGAAFQDRLKSFLDNSVRRVSEEKRISPPPQILGPVIEGIRYEEVGTPIEAMFSELLSCSMDCERVDQAHPAYPLIIKQLSSDEAKILATLKEKTFDLIYTLDFDATTNLFSNKQNVETDTLPRDNMNFPANVPFYFDHLYQLGLAGIFQNGNQEPLFKDRAGPQTGIRKRCHYRLTDLGLRFVQACNP